MYRSTFICTFQVLASTYRVTLLNKLKTAAFTKFYSLEQLIPYDQNVPQHIYMHLPSARVHTASLSSPNCPREPLTFLLSIYLKKTTVGLRSFIRQQSNFKRNSISIRS